MKNISNTPSVQTIMKKTLKVRIWEELQYIHPYRSFDSAEYYSLSDDIIHDKHHPARRFLSDGLKKELNDTL